MMAAGLVTLAHRSGGPLMDIVVETEQNRNGFLAGWLQITVIIRAGARGQKRPSQVDHHPKNNFLRHVSMTFYR